MSAATQPQETNFDLLLKSLQEQSDQADALAAKKPDDDAAVAAAAAEAGAAGAGGAAGGGDGEGDNPEDGEDADLKKSLEEAGMVDATDLLKALDARQNDFDALLAKSLGTIVKTMGTQQQLIKSLQEQVAALGGQGRGRKAILSIAAKPGLDGGTMAKSDGAEDGRITPDELMAKSNAAYDAGKISGQELNTISVGLRNGWGIDPNILTKVAAASKA